ncbi:MAG: hypothetical protein A2178_00580 [Planctomycetes bacterium GWC2_49_10]|nr:MAG: hypothetical protein A2178_00580 [Planctomycetes bacterium GWC2_49_10]
MTKIAAYTSDDINSAGSRLRSFYLFKFSQEYGVTVCRSLGLLESLSCDQLHLQKCYKPKHLAQALLFRILGKQVIFDICDQATRWTHKFAIFMAMKIASAVTTDTDARAAYCRRYVSDRKVSSLPDVLDVDPVKNINLITRANPQSKGILWTGHRGNLDSVNELLRMMEAENDFHMIVITNLQVNDPLHKQYPYIKFIQWTLDCIFDTAIDVGFMVLNHQWMDDPDSVYKSENKMVLSIAAGLIPIVSRTPAYEKLATALGAEQLVFDEFDEVFDIINSLDANWISDFFVRSQKYIIDNYSAENIFLKYKSLTHC